MANTATYSVEVKRGSVRTDSKIIISRPSSTVWDNFMALDWKKWNDSLYLLGDLPTRLEVGDSLLLLANHTLWYNPLNAYKVRVQISELEPGKKLVWTGRPMGVYGEHGFSFEDRGEHSCEVIQWEEGFGPMARLGYWMGVFNSIGRIHVDLLTSLKKHLEE